MAKKYTKLLALVLALVMVISNSIGLVAYAVDPEPSLVIDEVEFAPNHAIIGTFYFQGLPDVNLLMEAAKTIAPGSPNTYYRSAVSAGSLYWYDAVKNPAGGIANKVEDSVIALALSKITNLDEGPAPTLNPGGGTGEPVVIDPVSTTTAPTAGVWENPVWTITLDELAAAKAATPAATVAVLTLADGWEVEFVVGSDDVEAGEDDDTIEVDLDADEFSAAAKLVNDDDVVYIGIEVVDEEEETTAALELAKITGLAVSVPTANNNKAAVDAAVLAAAQALVDDAYTVTLATDADASTYNEGTQAWSGKFVVTNKTTATDTATSTTAVALTITLVAPATELTAATVTPDSVAQGQTSVFAVTGNGTYAAAVANVTSIKTAEGADVKATAAANDKISVALGEEANAGKLVLTVGSAVPAGAYVVTYTDTTMADGKQTVTATLTVTIAPAKAASLTIAVSATGDISGDTATAGGTLSYYLVAATKATEIAAWTVATTAAEVGTDLGVAAETQKPALAAANNGKFLVVVEMKDGKVVAAGQSEAIAISGGGDAEDAALVADSTTPVALTTNAVAGNNALAAGDVVTIKFAKALTADASNLTAIKAAVQTAFGGTEGTTYDVATVDNQSFTITVKATQTVDLTGGKTITLAIGAVKSAAGTNPVAITFLVSDAPQAPAATYSAMTLIKSAADGLAAAVQANGDLEQNAVYFVEMTVANLTAGADYTAVITHTGSTITHGTVVFQAPTGNTTVTAAGTALTADATTAFTIAGTETKIYIPVKFTTVINPGAELSVTLKKGAATIGEAKTLAGLTVTAPAPTQVTLGAGSAGTAGDAQITGLDPAKKYVINDGTNWMSVKGAGATFGTKQANSAAGLALAIADSPEELGTSVTTITTLDNTKTYTVYEVLEALPAAGEHTFVEKENIATTANVNIAIDTDVIFIKAAGDGGAVSVYNATSATELKTFLGLLAAPDKITFGAAGKISKLEQVTTTAKDFTLTTAGAGHTALEVIGNGSNQSSIDAVGIDVTVTGGKVKVLKADDVTVNDSGAEVELAPATETDITGAVTITDGEATLTEDLTMGSSKVMNVEASGELTIDASAADVTLTLHGAEASLVIDGDLTGLNGDGIARIVFPVSATCVALKFYPKNNTTAGGGSEGTYIWDAKADGSSTAGWKVPLTLGAGSAGIAGNAQITGLDPAKKYVVLEDSNVKAVAASTGTGGTLGAGTGNNSAAFVTAIDATQAIGSADTFIGGLDNTKTYTVYEVLEALPDAEYTLGTVDGTLVANTIDLDTDVLEIESTTHIQVLKFETGAGLKDAVRGLIGALKPTDKFTITDTAISKITKTAGTDSTTWTPALETDADGYADTVEVVGSDVTDSVVITATGAGKAINVTGGKVKITAADDVTVNDSGAEVELAPATATSITGDVTITQGAANITKDLTMGSGKVLTVAGTLTVKAASGADTTLTLDNAASALVLNIGAQLLGTIESGYKGIIIFGSSHTSVGGDLASKNLFYPSGGGTTAGEAVQGKTYNWTANADGGGTDGWKATN